MTDTGAAATSWWGDLPRHFRRFATTDCRVGAPLYARLASAAADAPDVLALLEVAAPDQRRAVLLFAAVHDLVLAEPDLAPARWYPSIEPDPDRRPEGDPWPPFRRLCADRADDLRSTIAGRVTQTNEIGRSLAIAAALGLVAAEAAQPLAVVEVGASAGLNLVFDRYGLGYGDGPVIGDPASPVQLRARIHGPIPVPVPAAMPTVAARIGLDRAPVDLTDPRAVRWLEACVFPDRLDRLARLRAAVALAAADPPPVLTGDAVHDLERAVAAVPTEAPLCVVHSWALTYVADRDGFVDRVRGIAARRPVWWVSVEPPRTVPALAVPPRDPSITPEMAGNTVTALVRVEGDERRDRVLAWSHPHLDWIAWIDEAARR